ncbi:MAG TPA: TonB-dependent receptor [Steroidobacteraceae bacterium]|nr:TonB-dependent receptor [Steroidobacteraceae bacterium]
MTDARAGDPVASFNLPAEPLPQALIDFYHQSGVQPGFAATTQMVRAKSSPVFGTMASSKALDLMLKGTGYTYQFDTDNSVDIIPADEPSPKQAATVARVPTPAPRRLAADQDGGRLDEVNVTGSLIRGVQDAVAPLLYLKPQQLAMADYETVQDALYSQPILSLNGPREDLGIDANEQYGAGLDLRGLGVGATLVLVNGERQPLSGLNGDFVDVSTIPLSAVERIEVLPDGASALYGSDAIAGVVNIIMRNDFDGARSEVRYGTAGGGRREMVASQLFGTHWSGGHAMLAYQYSDETSLAAAERPYAANADKTPYGGGNFDSYYSYPGNILNPQTMLPTYGLALQQSGQAPALAALSPSLDLQNQFAGLQLFPDVTANEFYATVAQDLSDKLQLFFEGRFAERDALESYLPNTATLLVPPSNPYYVNPYSGVPYVEVAYSFLHDYGPATFSAGSQVYMATLGGKLQLGQTWQATLSESYGRQSLRSVQYDAANVDTLQSYLVDPNPATAFNPFGATNPETLAAIEQSYPLHSVATVEYTRLVADGPVFSMPAGDAKLAVGFERREEGLFHDIADPLNPDEETIPQSYSRHIESLFSQLDLPLIGDTTNSRSAPRLELNVAGRYEHYSDFGGTFNPTFRIQWIPVQPLKLRASWGRSFRAPTLDNLYDTSANAAGSVVLPDPQSPTGRSLALVEQGSNPDLKQETAKTWTAGFDLAPSVLTGSTFSVTYYSIDYDGRIAQPGADNPFAVLTDQTEWSAVITRNPTRAQITAVCDSPYYEQPVSQCLASSPAAIIYGTLANLSTTKTTGLDLEAHDSLSGALGTLSLDVTGNYVFDFDQELTDTSPAVDIVNTVSNPLALRLRGTVGWSRAGPQLPGPAVDLAVNYAGGYKNPGSTLVPNVSPWTTVDLRVVYRTRQDSGWLGGMTFSLNATNLLNHEPPFVDDQFGYDPENVQALGRVVSVDISKRW